MKYSLLLRILILGVMYSLLFCPVSFSQKKYSEIIALADAYIEEGEYAKALPFALEAKEISRNLLGENSLKYSDILVNLGIIYSHLNNYEESEQLYLQALKIRKETVGVNHRYYANVLNNLGNLYMKLTFYSKAEPLFISALEIKKKTVHPNSETYLITVLNLATLYRYQGQYEKAQPLLLEVVKIKEKEMGTGHPDYASAITELAGLYDDMGIFQEGERLALIAKKIIESVHGTENQNYAGVIGVLGNLYRSMGFVDKAEPYLVRTAEIFKKAFGENDLFYLSSIRNLANLYGDQRKFKESLVLRKIIAEKRKLLLGENNPSYLSAIHSVSQDYAGLGDFKKAEEICLEAIEKKKTVLGEDHYEYATSLFFLGEIKRAQGKYSEVEDLYLRAINIFIKNFGEKESRHTRGMYHNLTSYYIMFRQFDKAEAVILKYTDCVKNEFSTNFFGLSESQKEEYIKSNDEFINLINSYLLINKKVNSNTVEKILEVQLLFKGLVLASSINFHSALQNSNDSGLLRSYSDWIKIKCNIAEQLSRPVSERGEDFPIILEKGEQFEKKLIENSQVFKDKLKSIGVTVKDIRESLSPDEAAIEFVRFQVFNRTWTDTVYYGAFVITRQDPAARFVELFKESEFIKLLEKAGVTATQRAKELYRGIKYQNNSENQYGKLLYNMIWQPMRSHLSAIRKISYSPVGGLNYIAFNILPINNVLVLQDQYKLSRYISIRQRAFVQKESQSTISNIVLFGNPTFTMDSTAIESLKQNVSYDTLVQTFNPVASLRGDNKILWDSLPGTGNEIKNLENQFKQYSIETELYAETNANESNIKKLSGRKISVLHIATHGYFVSRSELIQSQFLGDNAYTLADNPLLRNGMIFSGGNYVWSGKSPIRGIDDGILTALEIANLNLGGIDLVVLSACETALGDVKGAEGVFGMQRAFKVAGTKKMILTLWKVPDEKTVELMTKFYGFVLKGKTIETALHMAQDECRKNYPPIDWAAFVVLE